MHRILAEKSVNITELRKNPAKYFIDQPVAVLSNNRPAGYLLSASAFEALSIFGCYFNFNEIYFFNIEV